MKKYFIADLPINIETDQNDITNRFADFEKENYLVPNLEVKVNRVNYINEASGEIIIDDTIRWTKTNGENNETNISIYTKDRGIITSLDTNEEWSLAEIKFLLVDNEWEWKVTNPLFEILFRNCLINNDGIVIHASAIEWEGQAIVFTAPSETGKTTQSNLWKKYMGAKVLNGDRPAIKITDNGVNVYGTPWSGSSSEFINNKVPLGAIILLEQALENSIRKLKLSEALNLIMPRFFLPYNDKKMMDKALNTIEKIIQLSPVYLLKCRPDKEAVELVYEAVK